MSKGGVGMNRVSVYAMTLLLAMSMSTAPATAQDKFVMGYAGVT
jgi:hypothetical protein